MTENSAHALEVVGNLPSKYRALVKPGAMGPAEANPSPQKSPPDSKSRKQHPSVAIRRKDALTKLAVGQTLAGSITHLTDFGAFVDLGDVDGLIHISRLAKHRVQHPSEVVTPGEKVTVMVVEVDVERERVSLALKIL